MALTQEQRARRKEIPTSFFTPLMKGDAEKILNGWRRAVGDPAYTEEKSAETWPTLYGSIIEPVALDWHEKKTQTEITRRGEVIVHPHRPYVSTTLDGMMEAESKVIDVKAYSSFFAIEQIVADVTPQMVGQIGCTGALNASLLIVHGGGEPQEIPVKIHPDYEALVWMRVDQFWWCIENLVSPVERPDLIKPVIPPEQWRTINLDSEAERDAHNWAGTMIDALTRWAENKASADSFDEAKSDIKGTLPDDVARVRYANMVVRRARNNAVTIAWGR